MDSFAELIRGINRGRRYSTSSLPNTDPLSNDSVTDTKNALRAERVLESASAKSEKAFNDALNSYFKKFGLKYENGRLTSPAVDKAIERVTKKAQTNKVNADTLSAVINALRASNTATVGGGINSVNPNSKIEDTNPLRSNSITDIRNDNRGLLGK